MARGASDRVAVLVKVGGGSWSGAGGGGRRRPGARVGLALRGGGVGGVRRGGAGRHLGGVVAAGARAGARRRTRLARGARPLAFGGVAPFVARRAARVEVRRALVVLARWALPAHCRRAADRVRAGLAHGGQALAL